MSFFSWRRSRISAVKFFPRYFSHPAGRTNVRHWRSLDGHVHQVHALFEALPPSWVVFDSYLRFLYHIGERSLPEAFVRVASSLRAGDAQTMLADSNTVLCW